MTLDSSDEYIPRIVLLEDLEVRVKAVTIHINVEPASSTLWTNLYFSALDSRSHRKNRIVRDQRLSFPSLFLFSTFRIGEILPHLPPLFAGLQYSNYKKDSRN
jgi:hypothetical protein